MTSTHHKEPTKQLGRDRAAFQSDQYHQRKRGSRHTFARSNKYSHLERCEWFRFFCTPFKLWDCHLSTVENLCWLGRKGDAGLVLSRFFDIYGCVLAMCGEIRRPVARFSRLCIKNPLFLRIDCCTFSTATRHFHTWKCALVLFSLHTIAGVGMTDVFERLLCFQLPLHSFVRRVQC